MRATGTDGDELTRGQLKALIETARCVGEVPRAGKDAAGKALESEYYYVPEEDLDEGRRDAVVEGLRKPGLRNCRKQHKVSFNPNMVLIGAKCRYSNTTGASQNDIARSLHIQALTLLLLSQIGRYIKVAGVEGKRTGSNLLILCSCFSACLLCPRRFRHGRVFHKDWPVYCGGILSIMTHTYRLVTL